MTRRTLLLLTTLALCLPPATAVSSALAPSALAKGGESGRKQRKGPAYQALIAISKEFEQGAAARLADRIEPKGKLSLALDADGAQSYERKHAENKLETWFDRWTVKSVEYRSHEGGDGRTTGTFDVKLRRKGSDDEKQHRFVFVIRKEEQGEKKVFHLVKIARV